MSPPALRPIDQLAADWHAHSRSPDSREALARLARAEAVVSSLGANDLGDVVASLARSRQADSRRSAAKVLQAMIRSQGVHPLIPRAILQAMMPGLVVAAKRLSWGSGGDWQEPGPFLSDVVTTAWEVIVEWAGQDRDYAVLDLLSAVRCRLRRQLLAQRSARERLALGVDPDRLRRPQWAPDTTDLDELARAVNRAVQHDLDSFDAAVLYGNRVLGLTIAELARLTGRSPRHVVGRRDEAVRKLVAETCV
ncbi:MAG TPA: hypothetical protein VMB82_10655 [Acidimicrobiales bacterium]|nr:hypothetical protein [Acidimicrobiales bacterium]